MKTVADLIAEARRLGHTLTVEDGDRVRCRPRLKGEILRLAIANREALARELREEEDGELLPAPGDVVFGNGAAPPPEQPASKPKLAEYTPPISCMQGSGGALDDRGRGHGRRGAFDRGDDVDERRWD